jgi:hypothetical protein
MLVCYASNRRTFTRGLRKFLLAKLLVDELVSGLDNIFFCFVLDKIIKVLKLKYKYKNCN